MGELGRRVDGAARPWAAAGRFATPQGDFDIGTGADPEGAGLLLAGIVGNAQRMNVVVPIVCVSSAMLGGAQWPLEIVSSKALLAVANFVPIRHAMDALKGIAYYDYGWNELLWPLAVLVLFGVVFMGVGLRLVERRG